MPDPYVSEVKYLGGASLDFIEVVVDAGTDVSGVFVTVYNSDGTIRTVNALETLAATVGGKDIYVISTVDSSTFNGLNKMGAVALSDGGATPLQFISFDDGAPVVATEGVADGLTSDQIGGAGAGESLETTDGGSSYQTQTSPNKGTIPCFLKGTLIVTPKGQVAVEDLQAGDWVVSPQGTRLQVLTVLVRKVGVAQAMLTPSLRPVCIQAGAMGAGLPRRDLYLSRQHRVLINSKAAKRMFERDAVLVSAHHLLSMEDVKVAPLTGEIEYFHLLLEAHGVVMAHGVGCESFLVAPISMGAISDEARVRVERIFPDAKKDGYRAEAVALIPRPKQQRQLIARHAKNHQPLFLSSGNLELQSASGK